MNLLEIAKANLQQSISGRYITNEHILPFLESLPQSFHLKIEGKSVKNQNIYSVKVGTGKTKVYMWSQMHGNEATTTKAVIDLLAYLTTDSEEVKNILNHFCLYIIPILNPDGAAAYTRVNANLVDLNRDSIELTQPESQLLRRAFDDFDPHFAFNLHDQRTLFAAGEENHPATISFLAPSFNEARDVNGVRKTAMQIIVEIVDELKNYIPNQIGRFDDSFNLNCIGDRITNLGVPTILFEAGHFPGDYEREETRKITFIAILKALLAIKNSEYLNRNIEEYIIIPENKKLLNDILLKNVRFITKNKTEVKNLGIQYKEELKLNKISFFPIYDIDLVKNHQFGHLELDGTEYEINNIDEICEFLNKMNLNRNENGVFAVNDLLKN